MRSILKFFVVFSFIVPAFSQQALQTPAIDAKTAKVRSDTFDLVWTRINENHYDPTFGGVDWKEIRKTYEPKAASAVLDQDFHAVLSEMLGELKLSHFGILPPSKDVGSESTQTGITGIQLLMIGDLPVVEKVDASSSAAKLGVKPGFILSKIDGRSWKTIVEKLENSFAARKNASGVRKIYLQRALEAAMNGLPDSSVSIEFLDKNDSAVSFTVTRTTYKGEISPAMGNFPPQAVDFESKLLASDIGYIRFNIWVVAQMAKFRSSIRDLSDAKGLVIDLRGNPGGVGGMAPGIAGLLAEKSFSLGSMKTRQNTMKFIAYPQENAFLGKVVILTDHGSASTSEVFAAGLQETGRATVIGTNTAGAVLPSIFEKLPTGYMFQYAISDYRSPNGVMIEGRGVIPDIHTEQTRASLLTGGDAQLEEAVRFLSRP